MINFPKRVILEASNICNLRCLMCAIQRHSVRPKGSMTYSLYKKIIDEISQHEIEYLSLQGGGEPLLHKDIIKFIKYAKKKDIKNVGFATNAFFLTEEKAKKIIEAKLDWISFSVDGYSEDTYNKIRIGSDFKTVINNIKKFIELNKKADKKIKTLVSLVKFSENENELEKFRNFWEPLVDTVNFKVYQTYAGKIQDKRIEKDKETTPIKRMPCHQLLRNDIIILWDGNVIPCCRDIDGVLIYGNVNNDSIASIYNNEIRNGYIKLHKEGKWDEIPLCKNCYEWMF
jgi:spiro-SPASM protein